MQIDDHLREPLELDLQPAERLRLGAREPVAVQVEQVVVAAAARPALVVLGRRRLGVRLGGAAKRVGRQEPGTAVRVLERIDEHHRLAQDRIDVGVALGRQQMVRLEERRVAR